MDLEEFLECFNPEVKIEVKTKKEKVFSGTVKEFSGADVEFYWGVPGSVTISNHVIYLLVENQEEWDQRQEEEKRRLEEERAAQFDLKDREQRLQERAEILGALIWAQEHSTQVIYLCEHSVDATQAKLALMEQYGFQEAQAQAIIDMRTRVFLQSEKSRIREELMEAHKELAQIQEKLGEADMEGFLEAAKTFYEDARELYEEDVRERKQ